MRAMTLFQTCFRMAMVVLLGAAMAKDAAAASDPQKLVDDSATLIKSLLDDPTWADWRAPMGRAKAVIVAPNLLKAGLILGGAGGQCVISIREADTDNWSPPAFCVIGEASVGLQIGAEQIELVLMVMTRGAANHMVDGSAKLGGEAGVSVGLIGHTVRGNTTLNLDTDIYALARGQGLFGGLAIEGGWIEPDDEYNEAYYGAPVSPEEILIERQVAHPGAERLLAILREYGAKR